MDEFSVIEKFFNKNSFIGDDAAILTPRAGYDLAISADAMHQGVHFLKTDDPEALGHKILAVNLSDMAAMGARAKYATLTIGLPEADQQWLAAFSSGLFGLLDKHDVKLIGGDTTKASHISLSLQIIGEIPSGQAVTRYGARINDDIYVSGSLGGAALELSQKLKQQSAQSFNRLEYPLPRVELGHKLRKLANSMIDISDGLLQDLQHILELSKVSAHIEPDMIPYAKELEKLPIDLKLSYGLAGGEDYELLFTVAPQNDYMVKKISQELEISISKIGKIVAGDNASIGGVDEFLKIKQQGFKHFR